MIKIAYRPGDVILRIRVRAPSPTQVLKHVPIMI